MDSTKMQYEDITLMEILPEDEDELHCIAELANDEGLEHGVWLARAFTMDDEQLALLQNGTDPDTNEPLSLEDQFADFYNRFVRNFAEDYPKDFLKIWKIFNDAEEAGYMLYIESLGGPYLHFLTTDDYSDPEEKANLITKAFTAAVPFIDYFFNKTKNSYLFLYIFHEDVEDMEFSLGQIGFMQVDDMDYYDYRRLAAFTLANKDFKAFKESLDFDD